MAALAAAAAVILAPQLAFADSTIGQTTEAASTVAGCSLGSGGDSIQLYTDSTSSPSYTAPGPGSLTLWSTDTGTEVTGNTAVLGLEVWRADSTGYTLVAMGPDEPVAEGSGVVSFPLSPAIGVSAGDVLGLRFESGSWSRCADFTMRFSTDRYLYTRDSAAPVFGATGVSFSCCFNGQLLNVSATFVSAPTFTVPSTTDQCKKDGWGELADNAGNKFKNQGDCVSFVETGNPAAG